MAVVLTRVLLSVYVAATVRMPMPVVDQALAVIAPVVIMLAAVRVLVRLALLACTVSDTDTAVPSKLDPVIVPAALS